MAKRPPVGSQREQSGIHKRRVAARDDASAAYRERRAEIRAAAADVFRRHGFRGTNIGLVAEALGMDRATLYYYVGSKEELFDEVVTDAVLANVKMAEDILAGPGGAPEKLRAIVGSLMRSYAENYPFLYVFIQENLSHVSPTRSEWSKKMRAANKRYEEVVIEIIESGIAEGTIRPVPSPWVVAYGIIGMVAWTNRWFNPGTSPIDADDVAKSYADVLLQGLAVAD